MTSPVGRHYTEQMVRAKASEDKDNLLHRLYEQGERAVGQAMEDLLGRSGVSRGLTKVAERAAKTKGRVDKNVEAMLHLLNIPSRTDYHRLLVKIEHLQGSLVNLSMKMDRLIAAQERPKRKLKAKS